MSTTESRHSSETSEHYTPASIVEPARFVLGGIDLDPASSKRANKTVKAGAIYTRADNGFAKEWHAETLFLNPPGGHCDRLGQPRVKASKSGPGCETSGACGLPPGHVHKGCESAQKMWWEKLSRAWVDKSVDSAIFVCFSIELLQSTQVHPACAMLPLDFALCFPARRVAYLRPDGTAGKSPPHASCIVLLPTFKGDAAAQQGRFFEHFGALGMCIRSERS